MSKNFDDCAAVAKQFQSRQGFRTNAPNDYRWLLRNKQLDAACAHMEPAYRELTDELIVRVASKFSSRRAFKLTDQSVYKAAKKRGILERVCAHMDIKYRRLSDDQISLIATKYAARIDFLTGDSAAYQTAAKRGILDEVCVHMTSKGDRSLTDAEILQIAQQFSTRNDFKLGDFGAYTTAIRRGLIVEACSHMEYGATGFREDKPAVLYQFRIEFPDGLVVYKAGITNRKPKQRMFTMGIARGYKADLISCISFSEGRDARIAEKRLHRRFSAHRYVGPPVMRNGNTELFTVNVLGD